MSSSFKKIISIVLGFMLLPAVVSAEPDGSIVAKVSTLGVGLEYIHPVHEKVNIGIGVNYFNYDTDREFDDVDYDAELDLFSISLLGHFHPWTNNFRLSAGIFYNGNELSVDARPDDAARFTFNGVGFDAADVGSANGEVDFNNFAPYVGIGWGNASLKKKGLSFYADAGVMFHGEPEVSLNVVCSDALIMRTTTPLCGDLEAAVETERQQFEDDVDSFSVWPVVTLGVVYSF